jgi:hypothetical protein
MHHALSAGSPAPPRDVNSTPCVSPCSTPLSPFKTFMSPAGSTAVLPYSRAIDGDMEEVRDPACDSR